MTAKERLREVIEESFLYKQQIGLRSIGILDKRVNDLMDKILEIAPELCEVDVPVNELTTYFCKRVDVWCKKNHEEYCGDWMIAPVFENIMKEAIATKEIIKIRE